MMHSLSGKKALVTLGPTREPIDPVRFISNESSGKQGAAIAMALRDAGAEVMIVAGPVTIPFPEGCVVKSVQTAQQMYEACMASLPVDIAVCTAAVSDWMPIVPSDQKLKKSASEDTLTLTFKKTPDILASLSQHPTLRPSLVVGFAAETQALEAYARKKREKKQCDWIVANLVSGENPVFGSDENHVSLIRGDEMESWPVMTKEQVAMHLVQSISEWRV